jgi:hypothetical protein
MIDEVNKLKHTLWNEAAEMLEGAELEALQLRKLKKLLVYVYENSAHYKEKFDAAGVNPYEFTSLSQYKDYPTLISTKSGPANSALGKSWAIPTACICAATSSRLTAPARLLALREHRAFKAQRLMIERS